VIDFGGRHILLDIEGTTSSVSYVYDVMFPFARREMSQYVCREWNTDEMRDACELVAQDAGFASFQEWEQSADGTTAQELVGAEVERLMDADVKATGLKQLQGLVWRSGFESGELQAHLYDDVSPAIARWCDSGRKVSIYSSGSIGAQKLFFGHTIVGNLLDHFTQHFDTTTGPKKEVASYEAIASKLGASPEQILFLSDVVAELDAARSAGWQTALVVRPGNTAVEEGHGHSTIESFDEINC